MKKALMIASVASMIDLFNMENIEILQKMGFEVHVACNFEYGSITSKERVKEFRQSLEKRGIKTFHIPIPRSIFSVKEILKSFILLKNIRDNNIYQIVHCHSPIGGAIARLVFKNKRKSGAKVIYTAHGFHFYKGAPFKNWLIFYPIEKWLSNYTDCLITINSEDFNIAIEKKFKAKSIEKINGVGVDLSKFYPVSEKEKIQLRKKHNFNENDFILIYPAELNKNKNQLLLIEVIDIIKDKIPNIKLILAGTGELFNYYRKKVVKKGLEKYIVFTGYRTDIDELIKLSDISVASSIREGLGKNVIEGMACGLPVVATRNRGHNELVINRVNGFLVDINNKNEFANSIYQLFLNKNKRIKMGKKSLSLVKKYSINTIVNEIHKIYIKCLSKK